MRDSVEGVPTPSPGDIASLDQFSARWRDADPEAKQSVADAAATLRTSMSSEDVTELLHALERAGLDTPLKE